MAIQVVVTSAYLNVLRGAHTGGEVGFSYFRIGEGGWRDEGGMIVQRTPDNTLADLDCIENAGRYTGYTYYFEKSLDETDIDISEDGVATVSVVVDADEGNDNGSGVFPIYGELGLYSSSDELLVYATFPRFPKGTSLGGERAVELSIRLAFIQG